MNSQPAGGRAEFAPAGIVLRSELFTQIQLQSFVNLPIDSEHN